MMPRKRLDDLCEAIESGAVGDLDAINAELDKIHAAYDQDEWTWVRWAYAQLFDADLDEATVDDMKKAADDFLKVRSRFLNLVLNDANKEFDDAVRAGFGQDGTDEEIAVDFTAVRGEFETNKFVKQMKGDLEELADRVERFKQTVSNL